MDARKPAFRAANSVGSMPRWTKEAIAWRMWPWTREKGRRIPNNGRWWTTTTQKGDGPVLQINALQKA